jgi:predicted DNA-binding transcriptional regulator YafY
MSMKNDIYETSYSTLKLLSEIVNKDSINTNHIASILKNFKSERSNHRHFKTIQEFFKREMKVEVFERTGKGTYRIINKNTLQQALNLGDRKELLSHIQILKEVLPDYYKTLDSQTREKIDAAKKESDLTYIFHSNPMEDFKNTKALKQIEQAVEHRLKVEFEYKSKTYKEVRPLNIVFMEGNLYLACLTQDEYNEGFKFLRIHLVKNFIICENGFNETDTVIRAREFLREFQTPFSVIFRK